MARNTTTYIGSLSSSFRFISIAFVALFYLISVAYIYFAGPDKSKLDPEAKIITVAHWNLEDGYREGLEELINRFEQLKAGQGQKVKVIQTTVPERGYLQWFMTQLIGGAPADILQLHGHQWVYKEYIYPLSEYVGKENPFNRDTPLEGMSWKDSFVDGMLASAHLTAQYADYFCVGTCFHVYRLFVNLDLLEETTGSRKMPEYLAEWLEICEKVKEYAQKTKKIIIPIGIHSVQKSPINYFLDFYFSQVAGDLTDNVARFCTSNPDIDEALERIFNDPNFAEQLLAPVGIVKELGQYFCEGFSTMDAEQSKFLFYSGKTVFYPEFSVFGYSIVNNCPFEVGIIPVPSIGYNHKYSKYFTGKVAEHAASDLMYGIPKATKHFDLALEFLQFMTSYEGNQLLMGSCKWPPAVKKAKFEGILKSFRPEKGQHLRVIGLPWRTQLYVASDMKMRATLEDTITKNIDNPTEFFMERFRQRKNLLISECAEIEQEHYRANMERELQRLQFSVGLLSKNRSDKEMETLRMQSKAIAESYPEVVRRYIVYLNYIDQVKKM
ncbi:MAG: extracellular solute-binding protein [Planctomycetota bacterium]